MEDKTKTQGEIKTEVRRTKLLKNNAINVEKRSALIIYKNLQPGIKLAQNVQSEDTLRESVVQIM